MQQYNDHVIKWTVANYKLAEAEYRRTEAGMQHAMDMERQYRIAGRNALHMNMMILFDDARRRRLRWERMVNWWGEQVAAAQREMKRRFAAMESVVIYGDR